MIQKPRGQWENSIYMCTPGCTCVMLRQCELLEYPVGLPPPVVFRLSELGLPVVAVEIGEVGVGALDTIGPEMNYL